ncbi:MULE domain-containing protein [Aphis craccivora]|uniref:MULE domain-containing protein n=1 Tax=Aphis craccivora TaxID=307492 RepID=A0A6G0VZR3_APHCR|nr:MULE domain-containing protein [Aphis craccivora]
MRKISEGVTMEKILDDIRDNVHDILKVQTLITKKDLWNIKRDFNLYEGRTTATGRHLINRHHGLRRYDSSTNAPKAGGTGRQLAPDEYQPLAIAALRHATSTRQHGIMIARVLRTTIDNDTTLDTPALVRPRRSTDHHLRHQYIIDNGYSSTDTCEDDLRSTSARSRHTQSQHLIQA